MTALDLYRDCQKGGWYDPYDTAFAIVPSDTTDLPYVTRTIYVGGAGDLRVKMFGSNDPVTFKSLPGGNDIAVRVTRVFATGTTCTGIVGLV